MASDPPRGAGNRPALRHQHHQDYHRHTKYSFGTGFHPEKESSEAPLVTAYDKSHFQCVDRPRFFSFTSDPQHETVWQRVLFFGSATALTVGPGRRIPSAVLGISKTHEHLEENAALEQNLGCYLGYYTLGDDSQIGDTYEFYKNEKVLQRVKQFHPNHRYRGGAIGNHDTDPLGLSQDEDAYLIVPRILLNLQGKKSVPNDVHLVAVGHPDRRLDHQKRIFLERRHYYGDVGRLDPNALKRNKLTLADIVDYAALAQAGLAPGDLFSSKKVHEQNFDPVAFLNMEELKRRGVHPDTLIDQIDLIQPVRLKEVDYRSDSYILEDGRFGSFSETDEVVERFWGPPEVDGSRHSTVFFDGGGDSINHKWFRASISQTDRIRTIHGESGLYTINMDHMDFGNQSILGGAMNAHVSRNQVRVLEAIIAETQRNDPGARFILTGHYALHRIKNFHEAGLHRIFNNEAVIAFVGGHSHIRYIDKDVSQGEWAEKNGIKRKNPLPSVIVPSMIDDPNEIAVVKIDDTDPSKTVVELTFQGVDSSKVPGVTDRVYEELRQMLPHFNTYAEGIRRINDPEVRELATPGIPLKRKIYLFKKILLNGGHDRIIKEDVIPAMVADARLHIRLFSKILDLSLREADFGQEADDFNKGLSAYLTSLDSYYNRVSSADYVPSVDSHEEDDRLIQLERELDHARDNLLDSIKVLVDLRLVEGEEKELLTLSHHMASSLTAYLNDYQNWLEDYEDLVRIKRPEDASDWIARTNLFGKGSFQSLFRHLEDLPEGSESWAFLTLATPLAAIIGDKMYEERRNVDRTVPDRLTLALEHRPFLSRKESVNYVQTSNLDPSEKSPEDPRWTRLKEQALEQAERDRASLMELIPPPPPWRPEVKFSFPFGVMLGTGSTERLFGTPESAHDVNLNLSVGAGALWHIYDWDGWPDLNLRLWESADYVSNHRFRDVEQFGRVDLVAHNLDFTTRSVFSVGYLDLLEVGAGPLGGYSLRNLQHNMTGRSFKGWNAQLTLFGALSIHVEQKFYQDGSRSMPVGLMLDVPQAVEWYRTFFK